MATRVVCPTNCRQTGNYPETGLGEIDGDLPEADFGPASRNSPSAHITQNLPSFRSGAISSGPLLRSINKAGRIWGHGFTPKVIWAIVKANAKSCGLPSVAPHDLRSYAESRIMPNSTAVRAWLKEEPVDGSA
jgi:hypothetical protein